MDKLDEITQDIANIYLKYGVTNLTIQQRNELIKSKLKEYAKEQKIEVLERIVKNENLERAMCLNSVRNSLEKRIIREIAELKKELEG